MPRGGPRAVMAAALLSGALFGFGLALSTMVRPESVREFLLLKDFGLLLVMGGAAGVTGVAYFVLPRLLSGPILGHRFETHPSHFEARTFIGAALFGVGWGLAGVCPGPAVAGLGAGDWPLLASVVGILLGAWIQGRFFGRHHA